MSREIDERVVSMRFDNEDFERKSKQSINTLNELDEALKFQNAASGLNALEQSAKKVNGINFNGFLGSIQKLGSEVLGMTKKVGLYRIVNSGIQQIENTLKSFTIAPLTDGWGKYEQSIASVQKIVNATEMELKDVQPYIDKIRWFTDETSYSMEGMSNALGDFTSQGIHLDEATTAMIGIANAAGNAGSSAEKATHAMTGFAKALGRGHMEGSSWQWIRTSGIAIESFKKNALESAAEVGTLTKSVDALGKAIYKTKKGTEVGLDSFEAAFSEGWLDSKSIMTTLKKYGNATEEIYKIYADMESKNLNPVTADIIDEYGDQFDELGIKAFRASQETKTFTEAIGAVRTAVSSKWAKTWEIIFGDYGADSESGARGLWRGFVDELWEIFVEPGNARNSMLKQWAPKGREALFEGISNLWSGLKGIAQPLHDALEKIFPPMTAEKLLKLTEGFRDLTAKFRDAFPIIEETSESIEQIGETAAEVVQPVFETTEAIEELAKAVIRGDYGNGAERIEKLGDSFKKVQNKVNELLGCAFRYEIEQDEVTEGAGELAESLGEVEDQAKDTSTELDKGKQRMERLHDVLGGLASALSLIKSVLAGIASSGLRVLGKLGGAAVGLGDGVLGLLSGLGKLLKTWDENNKKNNTVAKAFEKVNEAIDGLGNGFSIVFKWIKQLTGSAYENLKKAATWVINFIKEVYGYLKNTTVFSDLWNSIKRLASTLKEFGSSILEKVIEKIQEFFGLFKKKENVEEGTSLAEKTSSAFEGFLGVVTKVVDFITQHLTDIGKFFGFFNNQNAANIDKVSASVGSIFGDASSIGKGLGMFTKFAEKFGPFMENVNSYKTNAGNFFSNVIEGISDSLTKENLGALLKKANLTALFGALSYFLVSMGNAASKFSGKLTGGIVDMLRGIKDVFVSYQEQIRANNIMMIAKAIGILALALGGLTFVDQDKLNNVTSDLIAVMGVLALIAKFLNVINMSKVSNQTGDLKLSINVLNGLTEPIKGFLNSIAGTFKSAMKLPALAMLLLSLGGTLLMFLESLKRFSEMWKADQGLMTSAVYGVSYLLAALVAAIGFIARYVDGFDSLWDVAALVLSISGAVLLLVNAISMMGKMLNEDATAVLEGFGMVTVILGVLALFIHLVSDSLKIGEEGEKFGSVTGAILSMVVAVVAIAGALLLLSHFAGDKLIASAFAISLIVVALGVAVNFITQSTVLTREGIKAQSTLPVILSMIVALTAIAGALLMVGLLPTDRIIAAGIVLGLLMGALAAVVVVTSSKSIDGSGFASSMLLLSVGILALAAALKIMGGVNLGSLVVLGAGLAAVAAAAWLMVKFNVATALSQVSGSLLAFGVGALALSAALLVAGYALPVFVQGLATVGEQIRLYGDDIALAIVAIIAVIVAAIVASKMNLVNAMTTLLDVISTAVMQWLGLLPPKLAKIILFIIAILKLLLPLAIPGVIEVLVVLINNVADGIRNNAGPIIDALGNLLGAVLGLLGTAIGKIGNWFSPSGHGFTDFMSGFFDTSSDNAAHPIRRLIGSFWDNITGANKEGAELTLEQIRKENYPNQIREAVGDGLEFEVPGVGAGGAGYAKPLVNGLKTAKEEAGAEAATIPGFIGVKITEAAPELQNVFSELSEQVNMDEFYGTISENLGGLFGEQLPGEFNTYGLDTFTAYGDGYTESWTLFNEETVPTNMDATVAVLESYEPKFNEKGLFAANEYGAGLDTSTEPEKQAVIIADTVIKKTDIGSQMYANGMNAVMGFVNGIRDHIGEVIAAGNELAAAVANATSGGLEEHSPSKLFERFGMYADMGLANGIYKFIGLAEDAATSLGSATAYALGDAMTSLHNAITGDFSSSPTLRPIVDMNDVDAGVKRLNTTFNGQRVSMAAASMEINNQYSQLDAIVNMTASIYRQLQKGQDLYLDDGVIAGRINRRLGIL